jgi:hypothetical protein
MAGTVYGSGLLFSYVASRPFPFITERLLVYHGISHLFLIVSLAFVIQSSQRRLTGYADNGLRWKRPEDKLRKYDTTSEFERATIWGKWFAKSRD